MKPALYYSITKHSHALVAITSEKKSARSWRSDRWYGRTETDGMPTNGATSQLYGRFDSAESARRFRKKIEHIHAKHQRARDKLMMKVNQLHRTEASEIETLLLDRGVV